MNEFDLLQKTKEIAALLGWLDPNPDDGNGWNIKISHPAGHAQLWLSNQHGRLRISGGFGNLHNWVTYERRGKNEITVNPLKTSQRIVRDIELRLFPMYMQDLAVAEGRYQEHLRRVELVWGIAVKFESILGLGATERQTTSEESVRLSLSTLRDLHGVWGEVQIGAENIDIRITDVPFDLAAMMLAPLGDYVRRCAQEHVGEDDNAN